MAANNSKTTYDDYIKFLKKNKLDYKKTKDKNFINTENTQFDRVIINTERKSYLTRSKVKIELKRVSLLKRSTSTFNF